MPELEFDWSKFDKYFSDLIKEYPNMARLSGMEAMETALDFLSAQVPEYPVETMGRLLPPDGVSFLRTDAQKRWFFTAVRAGDVPGWAWVNPTYKVGYRTYEPVNHSSTYSLKGEVGTGANARMPTEHMIIDQPGHPQKVGGARSGNLGRSKSTAVEQDGNGILGILGFDPALAPYAPWVVGDDYPGSEVDGQPMYQARVHIDRWWQFSVVVGGQIESAYQIFSQDFWARFSKLINQMNEKGL